MASKLTTVAAVNLTVGGTAQVISATNINVEIVVINATVGNAGTIYIGDSNVSSTRYFAALAAGERVSIEAAMSSGGTEVLDIAEIYFDGTTNDDINIGYIQKVGH